MTTPHQDPPDEAFVIGGGELHYGQDYSESLVRDMFTVPSPTPTTAIPLMLEALRMAPTGSLSSYGSIIPGAFPEDEYYVDEVTADAIVENLDETWWQRTWRGVIEKFTGMEGISTPTLDDAKDAMARLRADLAQNTRSIQDIQARDAGEISIGKVINIDFDQYPDGPIPSELFDVYYLDDRFVSPGTAQIGIDNGLAQFTTRPDDGPRDVMLVGVERTDTHYQIIRGTMGAPPMGPDSEEGTPKFHALVRVSDDRETYVFARAWNLGAWLQFRGEIGIVIDGVETIWDTNIPLTWSMDMTVVAGVGNNPHQYQVWSGSELVKTYTDATESCPLPDDDNFGWGSIAQIRGTHHSGKVGGCSVADNQLPLTIGTNAMMYRVSTTNEMMYGGGTVTDFPDNFFEIVGRTSRDIASDPEEGSFTVTKEGMYAIKCRVELAVGLNSKVQLVLRVNGSAIDWDRGITPANGEAMAETFFQYLEPGDIVDMAYTKSGGNLGVLTGEATGTKTYFSITRIPDLLPVAPVEE